MNLKSFIKYFSIPIVFGFIFLFNSTHTVQAKVCLCTPGRVCGTKSINIPTNLITGSITYAVCGGDCTTCDGSGLTDSYGTAGDCPGGIPSNDIIAWNQSSCPPGVTCFWSPDNGTCPANYAYDSNYGSCTLSGTFSENYNTDVCKPSSGGGGGGGGCSYIRSYYECETSNTGACGYLYANNGNKPTFDYVTQTSCGYTCNTQSKPCDSQISGRVYIDKNRDGQFDGSDTWADSTTVTNISINAGSTTFAVNTDGTGSYVIGKGQGTSAYAQLTGGTWALTATAPQNYSVTSTNPQNVTVSFSNLNPSNVDFGIAPQQYAISGTIFKDYNHDGAWNGNDAAYTGSTVTVNAVNSSGTVVASTTTSTGNYSLTVTWGDKYTIEIGSIPSAYKQTTANPVLDFTVNGADTSGQNIGITPLYSISGNIFTDKNMNGKYDTGDQLYTGSTTIHVSGGPTSVSDMTQSTGQYNTPQTLESGQYTVSLTSVLPSGYSGTTPLSWVIKVGDPAGGANAAICNTGGSPDATCGNPDLGNISNLNFGIYVKAWPQPICGDARFDSGYSQDIPSTANCNGTAAPYALTTSPMCVNPGVLFSGNVDPSYGSGLGASTSNIVVGDSLFPELFTYRLPNTSDTSYSFITTTLNNLTTSPTPLTSICPNLGNCVLSETTPGGVYTTQATDGPVSISISNSDGTYKLGAANYVFNIGGDLSFTSNVILQSGYSASFTSGGNIHVTGRTALGNAGEVGETDWTSMNPDLEGFFTANGNFSIDRVDSAAPVCNNDGSPIDKKLNIVGSVITNAGGTGGSLVNNREGCAEDLSCPVVTFTNSPIQILHAPSVLKPGNTFWQELNP